MDTPSPTIQVLTVTTECANAIVAAALKASHDAGFALAIAVVDAGGALKAFGRSDGAPFLTVDVSINKAWTAASFGFSTDVWNDFMANPKVAPLANHPRMTPVGGGYPLLKDGQIVGGLGVSGGKYDQDRDVALAVLQGAGFGEPTSLGVT